jgi:sugar (pentulose or hexulose) kinase
LNGTIPALDEEQRRVALWNQRSGRNHLMAALREEIEKGLTDFVGSPAHSRFILSQMRRLAQQQLPDAPGMLRAISGYLKIS